MDTKRLSGWRQLYRDALFEADRGKLSEKIEKAYHGIRMRRRQLWDSGEGETRERSELDAATYFLGLLANNAVPNDKPERAGSASAARTKAS